MGGTIFSKLCQQAKRVPSRMVRGKVDFIHKAFGARIVHLVSNVISDFDSFFKQFERSSDCMVTGARRMCFFAHSTPELRVEAAERYGLSGTTSLQLSSATGSSNPGVETFTCILTLHSP